MVAHTEIDVLLAGQTGVGKSSIANMIMGKPNNSPGAALVSVNGRPCTVETTIYVTHLEGVQCTLWDTRGLDEMVDNPGMLPKLRELFRQPDRDLKAICRKRIKQGTPVLIWCILASKIDVPVHWEQFHRVYVDYCETKAKPVVVLTKMASNTANGWEERCRAQLRKIGLDDASVVLFRIREHKRLSTPEYSADSQILKALISRLSEHEWIVPIADDSPRRSLTPHSTLTNEISRASGIDWIVPIADDSSPRPPAPRSPPANGISRASGIDWIVPITENLPRRSIALRSTPANELRDTQPQIYHDSRVNPVVSESSRDRVINPREIEDDGQDRPRDPTASKGILSRPGSKQVVSSRIGLEQTVPPLLAPHHALLSREHENHHPNTAPLDLTPNIDKPKDQYLEGGSFGDVYKSRYNSPTGATEVAIKSFRFRFTLEKGSDTTHEGKMVGRELGIWRRLEHPNIVPFLGIATGFGMQGSLSLVSAWMSNGTLQNFLKNHGEQLQTSHRLQFLWDISNGLDYLHSFEESPIIHGDLNGNNVLVDEDFTARLADFGYSTVVGSIPEALTYLQRSTARPGAIRWSAPELLLVEEDAPAPERTLKSDIYSFGCLSLQVLSDKQPWSECQYEGMIPLRMSKGQTPKRPASQVLDDCHWEFIQHCWSLPPERPTARKLAVAIQGFVNACPQAPTLRDVFSGMVPQS